MLDDFEISIRYERERQEKKFGVQNHKDGTGTPAFRGQATWHKNKCDKATIDGKLTFRHILLEEVHEALAERDPEKLKTELIQVAAVCKAWVEAIDRRV